MALVLTSSFGAFAQDVTTFWKVDYFEVVTKNNGEPDEKKHDAQGHPVQDVVQSHGESIVSAWDALS